MKGFFHKYAFIAITVLNSAISFIKSYLFMDILTKEELGYIAIFQSVIILVSFFQTGIIHGGYRMISFSIDRKERANGAVMSYLLSLYIVGAIGLLLYSLIFGFNWFWICGVTVGLFTLWNNWLTNLYIALGRTKLLSIIMFVSILISLVPIPLLYHYAVYGAIIVLAVQPITFIILSFIFNKDFGFKIERKNMIYVRLCLKYGFIPFFTGILYYLDLQMERMVIGFDLGLKKLGEYYLVFVYTGIFLVIPGALATINFPKMMKSLRSTKMGEFRFFSLFGVYYLELTGYIIIVSIATFWLLPIVVAHFLPAHIIGVKYVQIVFWGLAPFTLIDPISFIINAKLHYKQLLFVYLFALLLSTLSYGILYFNKMGSLVTYSYVNVLFFLAVSLGYVVYFFAKGRKAFTVQHN